MCSDNRKSMDHGKLTFVERDDSIFSGAIFMSNRETKLECLQRSLFGLPLSKSEFIRQVKTGMILFLFEHEERKLYGVFEATSDGALNIVPDAFISTGQSYPAQILFKRIWMCKPLCEDDFRCAIEENYYSPGKFHFGLSHVQVIKLVHLFHSRKINIKQCNGNKIPSKIFEKIDNTIVDEYSEEKREGRRKLPLPQASLDPPMQYNSDLCTTSMHNTAFNAGKGLNKVNSRSLSYPPHSYAENLDTKRSSIYLPDDRVAFHHFSSGKKASSTSDAYPQHSNAEILDSKRSSVYLFRDHAAFHHFNTENKALNTSDTHPQHSYAENKALNTSDTHPRHSNAEILDTERKSVYLPRDCAAFRHISTGNKTSCTSDAQPLHSYAEVLDSERTSVYLPHDHVTFQHFSAENKTSSTLNIHPQNSYAEFLNSKRNSDCPPRDHVAFCQIFLENKTSSSKDIHPQHSYAEILDSERNLVYLPHDHAAFQHFSTKNQVLSNSDMEYKPLPLQSSCYTSNFDGTVNPCPSRDIVECELPCSNSRMSSRMAKIQEAGFASTHVVNDARSRTEIAQHSYVSLTQPDGVFDFPDYIPLEEESQQQPADKGNQRSSLENSEYVPSFIPRWKMISKSYYSNDDNSEDDKLNLYQQIELDEYNAAGSSLYADSDLSRTSAFSCLNRYQNASNRESGEPSNNISLDKLLNILSSRRNQWTALKVSKQSIKWDNNEQHRCTVSTKFCDQSNRHKNSIERLPVQPAERHKVDQYGGATEPTTLDSDLNNDIVDEESFELPFYNFKRRNMIQKYKVHEDSDKNRDICGSEAMPVKIKRRRLVRPSLHDEEMCRNVKAETEAKPSSPMNEQKEAKISSHLNEQTEVKMSSPSKNGRLIVMLQGCKVIQNLSR